MFVISMFKNLASNSLGILWLLYIVDFIILNNTILVEKILFGLLFIAILAIPVELYIRKKRGIRLLGV